MKKAADSAEIEKDVITRMMDLTLGWAEYVERDEAEHPDLVTSAELHGLYQSCAEYFKPYFDSPAEIKEAVALRFVHDRLLSLLLKRKSKG